MGDEKAADAAKCGHQTPTIALEHDCEFNDIGYPEIPTGSGFACYYKIKYFAGQWPAIGAQLTRSKLTGGWRLPLQRLQSEM